MEIPIPVEGYKPILHGDESVGENRVRWAKLRLKDWDWIEENGRRGIWCLNVKGQEAISNY